MPLPVSLIDATTDPIEHTVDSRWLMAYSASVGAVGPSFLDTSRPAGVVGHPLFPVCVEWPAVLAARDLLLAAGLTRDEVRLWVHLTHDLVAERPVRPGDVLATTATIASMAAHRSGTLLTLDLRTEDAAGDPVCRTRMGTLYRDVLTDADLAPPGSTPAASGHPSRTAAPTTTTPLAIAAGAAHTYTECSRIWNPIHTDAGTVARAGLPGIVLHGTATLAAALSIVARGPFGPDGELVRSVRARFGALVTMPCLLEVRTWSSVAPDRGEKAVLAFDVVGPDGQPVIRDGWLGAG